MVVRLGLLGLEIFFFERRHFFTHPFNKCGGGGGSCGCGRCGGDGCCGDDGGDGDG